MLMSQMGHLQTLALQQFMSALPPKADINRESVRVFQLPIL